jgi:hypothetical protein
LQFRKLCVDIVKVPFHIRVFIINLTIQVEKNLTTPTCYLHTFLRVSLFAKEGVN